MLDLGSIRCSAEPMPLIETLNSLHSLSRVRHEGELRGWQRHAAARLPAMARPLLDMVTLCQNALTFIAPPEPELDRALRLVAGMPDSTVWGELRAAFAGREIPRWLTAFVGSTGQRTGLTAALRSYFRACLLPYWDDVRAGHEQEVVEFSRSVTRHGMRSAVQPLAETIHVPSASGEGPVTLAPSPLWDGEPVGRSFLGGELIVVYPTTAPLPPEPSTPRERQVAMEQLLGHTRAAILHNLTSPCGTTELARRVEMSMPTTSEHIAVLRATGLVTTTRIGKNVRHALTPLGLVLLSGRR
ncbi:ArsR/SmtB family transcription factor [Nonomuraea sp. KM88]|uniref:ArsR/SmtB family transcription factor n=1 Tax=Nonomuraea sp. KM88 TaxID=3457427 RepID=UPI003FCE7D3C